MGIGEIFDNVIKILKEEKQEILSQKIDKESNFLRIYLKSVDLNSKEVLSVEIFKMIGRKMRFTIRIEEKVIKSKDGLFLPPFYIPFYYDVDNYGENDGESILNIENINNLNIVYEKIVLRLKNEVCKNYNDIE